MVKYLHCNLNDIIADAKTDSKKMKALKEFAAEGKPSFLSIKRFYYMSFYPEMVPVAKPKPKTMWDKIADL